MTSITSTDAAIARRTWPHWPCDPNDTIQLRATLRRPPHLDSVAPPLRARVLAAIREVDRAAEDRWLPEAARLQTRVLARELLLAAATISSRDAPVASARGGSALAPNAVRSPGRSPGRSPVGSAGRSPGRGASLADSADPGVWAVAALAVVRATCASDPARNADGRERAAPDRCAPGDLDLRFDPYEDDEDDDDFDDWLLDSESSERVAPWRRRRAPPRPSELAWEDRLAHWARNLAEDRGRDVSAVLRRSEALRLLVRIGPHTCGWSPPDPCSS